MGRPVGPRSASPCGNGCVAGAVPARRRAGLRNPQRGSAVGAPDRRCGGNAVKGARGVRARRTPAADPDFDRALEAMTAPELRSFVRTVLDGSEDSHRASVVDSLAARAVKGHHGWRPNRPSPRIRESSNQRVATRWKRSATGLKGDRRWPRRHCRADTARSSGYRVGQNAPRRHARSHAGRGGEAGRGDPRPVETPPL